MSDDALISIVGASLLFGAPMIWLVVDSLAKNWRKARVAEYQAILKRDMLDRGFSADEIIRVIEAGGPPAEETKGCRRARCH